MVTIIPKADWVLYEQNTIETSSGIVLPDGSKNGDLCTNIVIGIGEKVSRVKIGQEIIVLPNTAMKMHFPERGIADGLRIVKEENIIAVVKDTNRP
jgi:co-chaperonin GroES (HSP10)